MRVAIVGSRSIRDRAVVEQAIRESGFELTTVLSGGAPGVDTIAEELAKEQGLPFELFPAQWEVYGRTAGFIRNEAMVSAAEAVIAVTRSTPGTADAIRRAKQKRKKLFVFYVE